MKLVSAQPAPIVIVWSWEFN